MYGAIPAIALIFVLAFFAYIKNMKIKRQLTVNFDRC